jgi:cysteine-S-conjugate beta-lyase
VENPLTALTLAELRERRSIKWRKFGPDVLPLFVAEMDTPLAEPIAEALAAAVARGDTGYAHPGRLPEAFAAFAARRYGWSPDPARMLVLPDVMRALAEILAVTSEPGDGVVVNTPVYPPFFSVVAITGRRVVASPLARGDDGRYALDLDALDRDLGRPDVRVYLLCNPHNPTGLVAGRDELAAIADIAERHGVVVVADEIHAPLTYPGVSHTPFATVAGTGIALVSASKAWNLPGLKAALAVAAGDADWAHLAAVPIEATFGTGLYGVISGEAAFTDGEPWLDALMAGLDDNRRLVADLLDRHLPGTRYVAPDATFLAWLDLSALGLGDDPAETMLHHGVALANGPAFGDPGRGFARLNFATSPELLTEAVRRMARALPPR